MASYPPQLGLGAFLPTTDVYDVGVIQDINVNSPEFKEFLVRLRQSINNVALVVNIKDSGYYALTEFVNGQAWFPNPAYSSQTTSAPIYRQDFRLTLNCGALPNTGTKAIPHGLTINQYFTFTRIFGCASDTTDLLYKPLPCASSYAYQIVELEVDQTNVYITTNVDLSNYNVTYVVIEYLKN